MANGVSWRRLPLLWLAHVLCAIEWAIVVAGFAWLAWVMVSGAWEAITGRPWAHSAPVWWEYVQIGVLDKIQFFLTGMLPCIAAMLMAGAVGWLRKRMGFARMWSILRRDEDR